MAVLLQVIDAMVVVAAVLSHRYYLCEVVDPQVGDILKEQDVCQVWPGIKLCLKTHTLEKSTKG